LDSNPGWTPNIPADSQASVTSLMIYNIFGGEILKTRMKNGWHFYNRINGECIDFTKSATGKSSEDYHFEDIPSTPDETFNYFEQEDYSTLYLRFINAYEAAIGLDK
jgi:hypothetical protein